MLKATINGSATVERQALRLMRLQKSIGRATGARKDSLMGEAAAILGDLKNRKAMLDEIFEPKVEAPDPAGV